jgi:putative intracellular protease/amidase
MKILMVMTSHDKLGNTGEKTGLWLEEFAAPYYVFKGAGANITLASPQGGKPPIDPRSEEPRAQTAATRRFNEDKQAQAIFAKTVKLSGLSARDYDAIFYPGGHGPLWDLAEDRQSIALIETMYKEGKVVGAVCHGPAVFRHTKAPDGSSLVKDKSVTGFANSEEESVGGTRIVPFLVEDMLKANGGRYSKAGDWQVHLCVDGNLITGQNPASAEGAGHAVLDQLADTTASDTAARQKRAV